MFAQPKPPLLATALLVLLAQLSSAHAHPGLDEHIARVTAQLAAQPQDTSLLLQRADLHRQHGQYDAALADLTTAAHLKPDATIVTLAQARVFSDAGRITNALASVQQFLAAEPGHPEALVIRARCEFKLNQVALAIADYSLALASPKTSEPDLWLERARAQAALGQLASAVSGLDEGMARLGEIPTLQLAAVEYERQRADFDAALVRVDKFTARYPVKEPWLVLRGEILAQGGRLAEAKEVFQQTLAGIKQYPPARLALEQTIQLQARAREGMARVEARLAKKSNS